MNMAWALAKLELFIPESVTTTPQPIFPPEGVILQNMAVLCNQIRSEVLTVAREKRQPNGANAAKKYVPTLFKLSDTVLTLLALRCVPIKRTFKVQELTNMLWAMAKSRKHFTKLFTEVGDEIIQRCYNDIDENEQLHNGNHWDEVIIKPQELKDSIWAFSTAGLRPEVYFSLLEYTARKFGEKSKIVNENSSYMEQFKPQELSNTVWGITNQLLKRDFSGGTCIDAEMKDLENRSMLTIFRRVASIILSRPNDFKPQEISNTMWAFASVRFGCSMPGSVAAELDLWVGNDSQSRGGGYGDDDNYIYYTFVDERRDQNLIAQTMERVAQSTLPRLRSFRPQELNNLSWAYARLEHKSSAVEALFRGIGNEIIRRSSSFSSQDIAMTLWSFATTEYGTAEVYKVLASEMNADSADAFKSQEFSASIHALATAKMVPADLSVFDDTMSEQHGDGGKYQEYCPFTECFDTAASELIERTDMFTEQEMKDIIWAFSKSGVRHPTLFKSVAEYLVSSPDMFNESRGYSGCSTQVFGIIAWSFAKQAQLAKEIVESSTTQTPLGTTTGRQATYDASCVDVGGELIDQLFSSIATHSLQYKNGEGLSRFSPQDLSNLAWAFATLGLYHKELLDAIAEQVTQRLSLHLEYLNGSGAEDSSLKKPSDLNKMVNFKPQELTILVWAYASIGIRKPEMFEMIGDYIIALCSSITGEDGRKTFNSDSISKHFTRQYLSNLAWGAAVLQGYTPLFMNLLYTGLFGGVNGLGDPEVMRNIMRDNGIQKQGIRNMLYVQVTLDMEDFKLGIALPKNFPEGWGEKVNGERKNPKGPLLDIVDAPVLELKPSRWQKTVSNVFQRLGFEFEDEHIIRSNDPIGSNGVGLTSTSQEFLSIDLANTKTRVGIEIDGPSHFINVIDGNSLTYNVNDNNSRRNNNKRRRKESGPYLFKDRLLTHLGWHIIHIPFWEWSAIGNDQKAQELYCRKLLEGTESSLSQKT